MKTKTIIKKLSLNKKTVSSLDNQGLNAIKGGTLPTEMYCKTTRDYPCPTDYVLCVTPNTFDPYC